MFPDSRVFGGGIGRTWSLTVRFRFVAAFAALFRLRKTVLEGFQTQPFAGIFLQLTGQTRLCSGTRGEIERMAWLWERVEPDRAKAGGAVGGRDADQYCRTEIRPQRRKQGRQGGAPRERVGRGMQMVGYSVGRCYSTFQAEKQ